MRKTSITNEQAHKLFSEYLFSKSKDDDALFDVIQENESYFQDMCLEADSIVRDFVEYEYEDEGEIVKTSDSHYIDLLSQNWRFYVKKLRDKDTCGETYHNERKIVINELYKNDVPTILHEMIHAHETIINQMLPFYHDVIMLCLYKDLSKKIPDLDERIVRHTHEYFGVEITYSGGNHDVLFFLKSLDLDLQLGYKLGTVCGYGRDTMEVADQ